MQANNSFKIYSNLIAQLYLIFRVHTQFKIESYSPSKFLSTNVHPGHCTQQHTQPQKTGSDYMCQNCLAFCLCLFSFLFSQIDCVYFICYNLVLKKIIKEMCGCGRSKAFIRRELSSMEREREKSWLQLSQKQMHSLFIFLFFFVTTKSHCLIFKVCWLPHLISECDIFLLLRRTSQ